MDMFRIGEFSKMTKNTIKTLRYYDEVQLLQLHRIQSLRQAGLSQAYAFAFQWIEENGMLVADSHHQTVNSPLSRRVAL